MSSKTTINNSQGVSKFAQSASTHSSRSQLRCWADRPSNQIDSQLFKLARIGLGMLASWQICLPVLAGSIPVDTDIPEEVLRAEIITEARSPIDGKALSATDFAELVIATKRQSELEDANIAANSPRLKETVILLRLRGFLRSVGIPIK
jgi:hypothetical protein